MENGEKEKLEKVRAKLVGFGYVRWLEYKKPMITIPEFKHMLSCFRIKKCEWYSIAKEFERDDLLILRGSHPILINMAAVKIEE